MSDSILSLLPTGEAPTEAAIKKAAQIASYRANQDFICGSLLPKMRQEVLFAVKTAQTSDDLWQAKGMARMVEKIEDEIKRGSKGTETEKR